jgi:hypothetical protein
LIKSTLTPRARVTRNVPDSSDVNGVLNLT